MRPSPTFLVALLLSFACLPGCKSDSAATEAPADAPVPVEADADQPAVSEPATTLEPAQDAGSAASGDAATATASTSAEPATATSTDPSSGEVQSAN